MQFMIQYKAKGVEMKIFENGYLKSEFINPNYRGLVGWRAKRLTENAGMINEFIIAVEGDFVHVIDRNTGFWLKELKIPQFTPKDIPVGELCWFGTVKAFDIKHWTLGVYNGCEFDDGMFFFSKNQDVRLHDNISRVKKGSSVWVEKYQDTIDYDLCVPYLIAETAEDAERLKEWNK